MDLSSLLLLFLIFSIHIFFIDKQQIKKLESFIGQSRFRRILFGLGSAAFFAYIVLWLWLTTKFLLFVRSFYEFSDYDVVIDVVIFIILIFIVLKVVALKIYSQRD